MILDFKVGKGPGALSVFKEKECYILCDLTLFLFGGFLLKGYGECNFCHLPVARLQVHLRFLLGESRSGYRPIPETDE